MYLLYQDVKFLLKMKVFPKLLHSIFETTLKRPCTIVKTSNISETECLEES